MHEETQLNYLSYANYSLFEKVHHRVQVAFGLAEQRQRV